MYKPASLNIFYEDEYTEIKKPTSQEKLDALEASIEHWRRMITWVKKQCYAAPASAEIMHGIIGETWGSRDCALCTLTYRVYGLSCQYCPLSEHPCETKGLPWYRLSAATTWGDWLGAAEEMLQLLVDTRSTLIFPGETDKVKPTLVEKLQAVRSSIKHWHRMIRFASSKDPEACAWPDIMQNAIGEEWYDKDCSLCQLVKHLGNCDSCPLTKYHKCGDPRSAWRQVAIATTWKDWLIAAEKMSSNLGYLESQLMEELSMEDHNKAVDEHLKAQAQEKQDVGENIAIERLSQRVEKLEDAFKEFVAWCEHHHTTIGKLGNMLD